MAANNKNEDDEEEEFSGFKFASSNPTFHSNSNSTMINGPASTNTINNNDDDDDDDWGDFSFVSNSSGLTHTLSLPRVPKFPSVQNQNELLAQPGSAPSRVNNLTQWEKPKGALPLSIFGDIEEEEEEEKGSGAAEPTKVGSFDFPNNNNTYNNKKSGSVNVSDLIVDLYKQKENNNGFGSDLNGLGFNFDDSKEKRNGVEKDSNWNWGNLNGNDINEKEFGSKGFDLSENGVDLKANSLNPVKKDGNIHENGVDSGLVDGDEDLHDDGWEFQAAETKTDVGNEISKVKTENGLVSNLNVFSSSWNSLSSDFNGWNSNVNAANSSTDWLNMGSVDGNGEHGKNNEWGFKDLDYKTQAGDENQKMNSGADLNTTQVNLDSPDEDEDFADYDGWEFKAAESESSTGRGTAEGDARMVEISDGSMNTFGFGNGEHGPGALFSVSQEPSQKSSQWDFGFDFNPGSLTEVNTVSKTYTTNQQNETKSILNTSLVDRQVDPEKDLWAFKDAFSETGTKDKEEPKVAEVSAAVEACASDGQIQGNMARSVSQKGALPLSIFGDEDEDANDPVIYPDISSQMPRSNLSGGIKSPPSNISINDLISSLYSQDEQNTAVNHAQNRSGNGLSSTDTVVESNLINGDDDFDDDSWEFKDASSGARVEDHDPFTGEPHSLCSTKLEPNDYVDFFCKLKEELQYVAQCHLDNLKKAQSAATGDNAEAQALDKGIQNLYTELQQDGLISGEVDSGNNSPRNVCLNEFVEVLQGLKFQMFESEYQLSNKLSSVENDLKSTVELLKLMASMIKILTMLSREEQFSYVSAWSKLLSVCAQELKHGAFIWKQSLEKDVHDQILSKPQGKNYIIALGEIYRVIEVLGSSARLYKPWFLVSSANSMGIFNLLSECFTLWSSSKLEEALLSISDQVGPDYNGGLKKLIESIKYVHDLDVHTLYNHVFSGQGPICQLSVLTAGTVPGMKTVVWNGEHYFVTLANLWANLVSCNPPNLPRVHVG